MRENSIDKIGGPYHGFFVLEDSIPYEKALKYVRERKKTEIKVYIPDDLIRYFCDFFSWIPTVFFMKKIIRGGAGLDYEGWSIIDKEGKDIFYDILLNLKNIFNIGPDKFKLTGPYVLDEGYMQLHIEKKDILDMFDKMIDMAQEIDDRHYIVHLGV